MKFRFRIHRRRLVRRVTLGLAIVAVAAPSAQALSLDPAALPCAPSCTTARIHSVSYDGTGTPRTVTIPPELSGRQFGPGATEVTPAGPPAVTIPEELSGRQFGPTGAASTADRATHAVPMRGGGVRFAHTATSNSDGAAGELGFGIAIGIAAILAVALVVVAFGRRPGDLAHA
jgi:hypothetical protein